MLEGFKFANSFECFNSSGERCLMRKGGSAGIVTLFSGIMVAIFTRALYENLLWKGW